MHQMDTLRSCLAAVIMVAGSESLSIAECPRVVVPGFGVVEEAEGLTHPTQVVFGPDDRLYVATQAGEILTFDYGTHGISAGPKVVAVGIGSTLLGIAFDGVGRLYASSNEGKKDTGFIAQLRDLDGDGVFELQNRFVTNLPNAGHQNNQLAIADSVLFVGMGSRTDDGEQDDIEPVPAATILRIDLSEVDFSSTGNTPAVYAMGLRNPFGIALGPNNRIWVGDNGRDSPLLPDELHAIVPNAHHGFPDELAPKNAISPVATLGLGTSADGLDLYDIDDLWGPEYAGNVFIARFDFELNDPTGRGMDVVRVVIEEPKADKPLGEATVFATGFYHPLDIEVDPFGNLVVMEYGSFGPSSDGRIYRIVLEPLSGDLDDDGDVDVRDIARFQNCYTGDVVSPVCCGSDLNADSTVDLSDYQLLQPTLTGPTSP